MTRKYFVTKSQIEWLYHVGLYLIAIVDHQNGPWETQNIDGSVVS